MYYDKLFDDSKKNPDLMCQRLISTRVEWRVETECFECIATAKF
jgi:hypothetical protein